MCALSLEVHRMSRYRPRVPARPALLTLSLLAPVLAVAETEFTVNGVEVDRAVVDIYAETRLQKPAAQVSSEERQAAIDELTDIYLLTTQSRAKELADDPKVKAQLELQTRGTLAQAAATDFLQRNQATDEEILAEYGRQIELAPKQQYKASHILVETQAAANDLIAKLGEGADFAELAKTNSTGPSAPEGGSLPWFSPEQMVPPFSAAVETLKDGEFTKAPVQTQFGWHVILREDSRPAEPPTLDSVRDVIKQQIEQRKLQEYLTQLRELNS